MPAEIGPENKAKELVLILPVPHSELSIVKKPVMRSFKVNPASFGWFV